MDNPRPPADDQPQLADNQQPPPYDPQPSAPTDDQQPSAPTDNLKPLADTKRPPTDDELPPAYDQLTKKNKFVTPPLSASRWPSPYSQQPYIPLKEYPEQSDKPVVDQPARDGIFSVYNPGQRYTTSAGEGFYPGQRTTSAGEGFYPGQRCTTSAREGFYPGQRYTTSTGEGFYPGQRYTTTEKYPEDECLQECKECCEFTLCLCYCLRCVFLFCEILAACK